MCLTAAPRAPLRRLSVCKRCIVSGATPTACAAAPASAAWGRAQRGRRLGAQLPHGAVEQLQLRRGAQDGGGVGRHALVRHEGVA